MGYTGQPHPDAPDQLVSYRALRRPAFASPAAWAEILGPYPASEPLEGSQTADAVIVGAGFAGLSAARQLLLLDETLNIIVLDALRIAEGTAGRNSGFMIDLPHDLVSDDYAGTGNDQALIGLNRQAIVFARAAVAEFGIDPAFADPMGKINGAASVKGDAHNRSYSAHLAALDEPFERLDAQAMRSLTGSAKYLSGLYTPGSLILQPAGYVRGLATGLRTQGVQIAEQSPVVGFNRQGSGWLVKTPQGHISTPRIILANNGHLESFGIAKGALMQVFLFASMTPELDAAEVGALGGAPRWGVTPADPMGTTLRRIDGPQGGNRIVTRTCAVLRPDMQASQTDVARATAVQAAKFAAHFPQLADMAMQYTWAGHLCLTRNGVSVTRQVDEGVFAACVQNGLGTARGTLAGIAAAAAALDHSSDITRHFATEPPPKPLPPQPFARWGANAYLRWKEWRARAE